MSFYLGAGVNGQFDVVKCDLDLVLHTLVYRDDHLRDRELSEPNRFRDEPSGALKSN